MLKKLFLTIVFTSIIFLENAFTFSSPLYAYATNMNASVVIGQADFTHGSTNGSGSVVGPNGFSAPRDVLVIGQKLIVADLTNHRVLIWNTIPTTNNASADVVIGQTNFTSNSIHQGGSASANTTNTPQGLATDGTRLFMVDNGAHRVFIYNQVPTTNNASADLVIGQPDMTTVSSGTTQSTLKSPTAVSFDPVTGKLAILDKGNNRVLIYNRVPTANGAAADTVVGQTDFISGGSEHTASTLSTPFGVAIAQGKLIVTDFNNSRILIWNSIPTTNGSSADVVIGQTNFTNNGGNQGGRTASTLSLPGGAFFDGKRLFVTDGGNSRILIFNGIPNQNNASAYMVLGQTNFTSGTANQGIGSARANTINLPFANMASTGNLFIVADGGNQRVLIYTNIITPPGLSLSNSPMGADNGQITLTGNARVDGGLYTLQNVEYSVNGGVWNSATPVDGSFNSTSEAFTVTFDPNSNKSGTIVTSDRLEQNRYVVTFQSTNSNLDVTDTLLYFSPFTIGPTNTALSPLLSAYAMNFNGGASYISSSPLPAFSVGLLPNDPANPQLFSALTTNIEKLQVQIQKMCSDGQSIPLSSSPALPGGGNLCNWTPYIDNIPIDYQSVQNNPENLQNNTLGTNGNGIYETTDFWANYSSNNSAITIVGKGYNQTGQSISLSSSSTSPGMNITNGGRSLPRGIYRFKITAFDKLNHQQDSPQGILTIATPGSSNEGTAFFPLTLSKISGGTVNLSTENPQLITNNLQLTTSSLAPTLSGIAFANSTITATIDDGKGGITTQTTTAAPNSRYTLSIPPGVLRVGNTYLLTLSVAQNGNYNVLPPVQMKIVSPTPITPTSSDTLPTSSLAPSRIPTPIITPTHQ